MRKVLSVAVVTSVIAAAVQPAVAATGTVPFAGLVTATCVLTVGTSGVIAPNSDFTILSSTSGAGATPGTIAALSTGTAFKVSAIAPTAFTAAPATGGDNVSFTATYAGSGASTIGTTPGGTQTLLASGTTNLTINMQAQKSAGNFAAGAYAAEVLVRCE